LLEIPQLRGEIACLSDTAFSQSTRSVITFYMPVRSVLRTRRAGMSEATHCSFSSEAVDVEFSTAL
jgi:hypothetical protein